MANPYDFIQLYHFFKGSVSKYSHILRHCGLRLQPYEHEFGRTQLILLHKYHDSLTVIVCLFLHVSF